MEKGGKILQGILGTNVRAPRIKEEMSQDKLAEKSGLSVNEIGKIESKQADPCLEVLAALAKGSGPCVVIPGRTEAGKDSDGAVLFTGNGGISASWYRWPHPITMRAARIPKKYTSTKSIIYASGFISSHATSG